MEVRAADLRFTREEAAAYLNQAAGLDLEASQVAALEERTEGWIAALQLAALSMQGRDDVDGFIAGFTGDDRFVVDYLVEEVLERQSDDVRRFLLWTCILDRLTGALCDAVTGEDGGQSTLEDLDRRNLFVIPLDARREWYRYHHLFADVLRARLLREEPDRVPDLHRRASIWYEQRGERFEAIRHALAGEDYERAADMIEPAIPGLRQARQEATMRRWFELASRSGVSGSAGPERRVCRSAHGHGRVCGCRGAVCVGPSDGWNQRPTIGRDSRPRPRRWSSLTKPSSGGCPAPLPCIEPPRHR